MSHLILKKVNGKWQMFNKKTEKNVGEPMSEKKEAEDVVEIRDDKEDKKEDTKQDIYLDEVKKRIKK